MTTTPRIDHNTINQALSREQELKLRTATTWIPLTLVGTIVAVIMYATWTLSTERSQIYGRIDQVSNDVKAVIATVNRLAEIVNRTNPDILTQTDWKIDCLRLQILNPSWKCIYSDGPGSVRAKGQQ